MLLRHNLKVERKFYNFAQVMAKQSQVGYQSYTWEIRAVFVFAADLMPTAEHHQRTKKKLCQSGVFFF